MKTITSVNDLKVNHIYTKYIHSNNLESVIEYLYLGYIDFNKVSKDRKNITKYDSRRHIFIPLNHYSLVFHWDNTSYKFNSNKSPDIELINTIKKEVENTKTNRYVEVNDFVNHTVTNFTNSKEDEFKKYSLVDYYFYLENYYKDKDSVINLAIRNKHLNDFITDGTWFDFGEKGTTDLDIILEISNHFIDYCLNYNNSYNSIQNYLVQYFPIKSERYRNNVRLLHSVDYISLYIHLLMFMKYSHNSIHIREDSLNSLLLVLYNSER